MDFIKKQKGELSKFSKTKGIKIVLGLQKPRQLIYTIYAPWAISLWMQAPALLEAESENMYKNL